MPSDPFLSLFFCAPVLLPLCLEAEPVVAWDGADFPMVSDVSIEGLEVNLVLLERFDVAVQFLLDFGAGRVIENLGVNKISGVEREVRRGHPKGVSLGGVLQSCLVLLSCFVKLLAG